MWAILKTKLRALMEGESFGKLVPIVLSSVVTLVSVYVGSKLALENSLATSRMQYEQSKSHEVAQAQQRSYARLKGLLTVWAMAKLRHTESNIDARYAAGRLRLAPDPANRELHIELVQRTNELADRFAEAQRQVFETLGEIEIAFAAYRDVRPLVDAVYNYPNYEIIGRFHGSQTPEEMDRVREDLKKLAYEKVRESIEAPTAKLLDALRVHLRDSH
jgi:hypothetical protein